ncbi:MAG: hypothetical protein Q9195_008401 [Heterodermia aff. obscurata]
MEIIAGIASVAQLIRYAVALITAISDLHQQSEGRPAVLRQRIRQLESLGNTVESVRKNSWLRAPIIREHIDIILTRVRYLTSLLEKEITHQKQSLGRRYLRVWLGVSKEQKILDTLNDLESGKSALLLSIAEAHTEISGNIHETILQGWQAYRGRMSSNSGNQAWENSRDYRTSSNEVARKPPRRMLAAGGPNASGNNHQEEGALSNRYDSRSSDTRQNLSSATKDKRWASDQPTPRDPQDDARLRRAYQNNLTGNYYGEKEIGKDSRNINGNVGKTEGPNNWYERDKIGDNSRNINGNFVDGADLKASGFWGK